MNPLPNTIPSYALESMVLTLLASFTKQDVTDAVRFGRVSGGGSVSSGTRIA